MMTCNALTRMAKTYCLPSYCLQVNELRGREVCELPNTGGQRCLCHVIARDDRQEVKKMTPKKNVPAKKVASEENKSVVTTDIKPSSFLHQGVHHFIPDAPSSVFGRRWEDHPWINNGTTTTKTKADVSESCRDCSHH